MNGAVRSQGDDLTKHRILVVATIARTIDVFFTQHIAAWRSRGWLIQTCAAGTRAEVDIPIQMSRRPFDLANMRAVWTMRKTLRATDPTVVVVTTPIAAAVVRLASLGIGIDVVYVAQGFHFQRPFGLRELVWLGIERLLAINTALLVTICKADYEEVKSWRRVCRPKEAGHICGIGVPETYSSTGDRSSVPNRRIGFMGELNANKRPELVLEAISRLDETFSATFAGIGPCERAVKDLAQHLGVEAEFRGWVRDVESWLRTVDVLVLPSKREGIPRCILEAMMAGVPVVATPSRGAIELLADGAGVIVRPRPDEIAKAILRLSSEPELRSSIVDAAHRRVESYRSAVVVPDLTRLLESVLQRRADVVRRDAP